MPEWLVQVSGDPKDLELLARERPGKYCKIRKERIGYCLKSIQFENFQSSDQVREVAQRLIERMNHVATFSFPGFLGVKRGAVESIEDDGSKIIHLQASLVSTVSLRATAICLNGTIAHSSPSDFSQRMELSEVNEHVADAFKYLSEKPNWYGLSKVLEAIGKTTNGRDGIAAQGWATKKELKRFAQSAQQERHHRSTPHRNPMALEEADGFIRMMFDKWLRRESAKCNKENPDGHSSP